MPVTHEEGDRYPLRPPVFADVAQRKSIRLISERPTFRNCPSVPVLESIQQIKNFTVNEKKRILLYFWRMFPVAGCNPVGFVKQGGCQVVRFHHSSPVSPVANIYKVCYNSFIAG